MKYETIRQASKRPDLPNECALRRMVKTHECPGFFSGTRFYVDTEKLLEKLESMSAANTEVRT